MTYTAYRLCGGGGGRVVRDATVAGRDEGHGQQRPRPQRRRRRRPPRPCEPAAKRPRSGRRRCGGDRGPVIRDAAARRRRREEGHRGRRGAATARGGEAVTPQRVAASGALAGGISAKAALPAPAAAAGEGAGAAGGAPAGAPAPAAPASAAAWRSLRAAQPPRLRGASLGPRKSTRRRGPTASADRCRTPACIRAVLR